MTMKHRNVNVRKALSMLYRKDSPQYFCRVLDIMSKRDKDWSGLELALERNQ